MGQFSLSRCWRTCGCRAPMQAPLCHAARMARKSSFWIFFLKRENISFPSAAPAAAGSPLGNENCIAFEAPSWRFKAILLRPLLGRRRLLNLAGMSLPAKRSKSALHCWRAEAHPPNSKSGPELGKGGMKEQILESATAQV